MWSPLRGRLRYRNHIKAPEEAVAKMEGRDIQETYKAVRNYGIIS